MSDYEHEERLAAFTDRVLELGGAKPLGATTPEEELVLKLQQAIRPQEDLSLSFRQHLNTRLSEEFDRQKKMPPRGIIPSRLRSVYALAAMLTVALVGLTLLLGLLGEGAEPEASTATTPTVSTEVFVIFLALGALTSFILWWSQRKK
jgi:hypothetical protein